LGGLPVFGIGALNFSREWLATRAIRKKFWMRSIEKLRWSFRIAARKVTPEYYRMGVFSSIPQIERRA
jgi:hypothetical protein